MGYRRFRRDQDAVLLEEPIIAVVIPKGSTGWNLPTSNFTQASQRDSFVEDNPNIGQRNIQLISTTKPPYFRSDVFPSLRTPRTTSSLRLDPNQTNRTSSTDCRRIRKSHCSANRSESTAPSLSERALTTRSLSRRRVQMSLWARSGRAFSPLQDPPVFPRECIVLPNIKSETKLPAA